MTNTGLTALPPEILVEVAMHMGPKEWLKLTCVNRAFRLLFSHQPFWRRLHLQRRAFGVSLEPSTSKDSETDWRWQCLQGWAADKWRGAAHWRWRQRRLEGHQGSVRAVQLLQKYVVSGALDGRLKVWERDTGRCRYSFSKHQGAITCLRYDSHTRVMVSGSLDRTLHMYNLQSGITDSIGHAGQVLALQMRDDTLYTGGSHCLVYLYSVTTKKVASVLTGHDGSITSLSSDWASHLLASGGAEGIVKLADPRLPRSVLPEKLIGHTAAINAVSVKDNIAVTSSHDQKGELFVWDLRSLGERNNKPPTALLKRLASEHPVKNSFYDGTKLFSSTAGENCVRVWDPRDWTCAAKWPHRTALLCIDGPSLGGFVAGGQDYNVYLWEKQSKKDGRGLEEPNELHRSRYKRKAMQDDPQDPKEHKQHRPRTSSETSSSGHHHATSRSGLRSRHTRSRPSSDVQRKATTYARLQR